MNVSGAIYASSPYITQTSVPRQGQAAPADAAQGGPEGLGKDDIRLIAALAARDREVRAHEQAHLAAAGGLAVSGASFSYQRGPDGVNYAIGGEVRIDTSPGRTPEETISRAQIIRSAALAPSDPSAQDRAVAAQASRMEMEAKAERSAQEAQDRSMLTSAARSSRLERYYDVSVADRPGQQIDVEV